MSNVRTKPVELVTTTCTGCGEGLDQPFGAVNVHVCAGCLTKLAAKFWATLGNVSGEQDGVLEMAKWDERFNEGTGTYTYTSETFPGYEITWALTKPQIHTVWAPVGIIGVKPSFAEAEQHVVEDSELVGHATQIKMGG